MQNDEKLIDIVRDDYEAELKELETMICLQQRKLDLMKQRRLLPNYEEMLHQAYSRSGGQNNVNMNNEIHDIERRNDFDAQSLNSGINNSNNSVDDVVSPIKDTSTDGIYERRKKIANGAQNFDQDEDLKGGGTDFSDPTLDSIIEKSRTSSSYTNTSSYHLLEEQDKIQTETRSDIYDSWNERKHLSFWEYIVNIFNPEVQFQKRRRTDPITYFHRLTVDLANERTWLAWIRTSMSIIRTLIVLVPLSGTNKEADVLLRISTTVFAVLSLWMIFQGSHRYRKIKIILSVDDPPKEFHRLSNFPIIVTIVAVVLVSNTLDVMNLVKR